MAEAWSNGTLGILCGGGRLPIEVAECVMARGRAVHLVAIRGEADADLSRLPHTFVGWGGVGAILSALRANRCRQLVIVGGVRRPNLAAIRPDLGFLLALPHLVRMLSGGDDSVLRGVVRAFEARGIEVVGAGQAAPELLAGQGALTSRRPTPAQQTAIARGQAVIAALGRFDLGQAVVAAPSGVLAIEGADGTDAMLRRLGVERGERSATADGVLVKLPKPGQEMRIDLPTIGPATVELAAAAGLAGIAVATGQTLLADSRRLLQLADSADLFVAGQAEKNARPAVTSLLPADVRLDSLDEAAPRPRDLADIHIGLDLVAELAHHLGPCAAVVSRRYVLAVEPLRRAHRALERAQRAKPWGIQLLRRHAGVLIVAVDATTALPPGPSLYAAAVAAGLSGIVLTGCSREAAVAWVCGEKPDHAAPADVFLVHARAGA